MGAEDDDYVLNHSKRIMWEGLKFLSRRDVVREGDGPAMMMDWKFDLLQFWQNKHPKYLINAHFMLAGQYTQSQSGFSLFIVFFLLISPCLFCPRP